MPGSHSVSLVKVSPREHSPFRSSYLLIAAEDPEFSVFLAVTRARSSLHLDNNGSSSFRPKYPGNSPAHKCSILQTFHQISWHLNERLRLKISRGQVPSRPIRLQGSYLPLKAMTFRPRTALFVVRWTENWDLGPQNLTHWFLAKTKSTGITLVAQRWLLKLLPKINWPITEDFRSV